VVGGRSAHRLKNLVLENQPCPGKRVSRFERRESPADPGVIGTHLREWVFHSSRGMSGGGGKNWALLCSRTSADLPPGFSGWMFRRTGETVWMPVEKMDDLVEVQSPWTGKRSLGIRGGAPIAAIPDQARNGSDRGKYSDGRHPAGRSHAEIPGSCYHFPICPLWMAGLALQGFTNGQSFASSIPGAKTGLKRFYFWGLTAK